MRAEKKKITTKRRWSRTDTDDNSLTNIHNFGGHFIGSSLKNAKESTGNRRNSVVATYARASGEPINGANRRAAAAVP